MSVNDKEAKDAYKTLKLPEGASEEEIKKRYRKLAKELHSDITSKPDKEDQLKKINRARETIRTANKEKQAGGRAKTAADERTKQAEEARKARARSASEARSAGDAFHKQASAGTSGGGGADSGTSTGAGSSTTGGQPASGTKPGYVPPRTPVTPPSGGSGSRPVPVEQSALVVVSCVAAVAIIGLVVGAIVGAAHPGNHLPNNPLFAPFAILCLIVCPTGTLFIRSSVPQSSHRSFAGMCLGFVLVVTLSYMVGILIAHGGHFPTTA